MLKPTVCLQWSCQQRFILFRKERLSRSSVRSRLRKNLKERRIFNFKLVICWPLVRKDCNNIWAELKMSHDYVWYSVCPTGIFSLNMHEIWSHPQIKDILWTGGSGPGHDLHRPAEAACIVLGRLCMNRGFLLPAIKTRAWDVIFQFSKKDNCSSGNPTHWSVQVHYYKLVKLQANAPSKM